MRYFMNYRRTDKRHNLKYNHKIHIEYYTRGTRKWKTVMGTLKKHEKERKCEIRDLPEFCPIGQNSGKFN